MFVVCFFFAKDIYNILVWPFVWVAGAESSKFIYTALLEYFITQLKLAMFGRHFSRFRLWRRRSTCSSLPVCIAMNSRLALPDRDPDILRAGRGSLLPRHADAGEVLARDAARPGGGSAEIALLPKVGEYLR